MFSRTDIDNARNRFYPGWWTYSGSLPQRLQPLFFIDCTTDVDYQLAHFAKPANVRAEIRYIPESC